MLYSHVSGLHLGHGTFSQQMAAALAKGFGCPYPTGQAVAAAVAGSLPLAS